jgi:hypothetical protein
MSVREFRIMAKKLLESMNEDAGSEGMKYIVEAKSGLKAVVTKVMEIDEVKSANGITSATVTFTYPHDYGTALEAIKNEMKDINITALKLVF